MSLDLGKPNLSEYVVRPANPKQAKEVVSWARHYFTPGGDKQLYDVAMGHMHQQEYYKNGRYIPWVLVKRGEEEGEAYTYAETSLRDAWVKDHENGVRDAKIYAVTFVSTPEKYQRKGFSRRLLRVLHYLLNPSTGWPSTCWGPVPDIEALRDRFDLQEGIGSYLSSVAPEGFYEAALIGPDGDNRQGWISRRYEGAELVFALRDDAGASPNPGDTVPPSSARPTSNPSTPWTAKVESTASDPASGPWEHAWIYEDELPAMVPIISKLKRAELEDAPLPDHSGAPSGSGGAKTALMAIDPASPGLLQGNFFEYHWLTGANTVDRRPTPRDVPVGIRFYRRDRPKTESTTQPVSVSGGITGITDHRQSQDLDDTRRVLDRWDETQPLILFVRDIWTPGELSLTLTLNLHPTLLDRLLALLKSEETSEILDCDCHTLRLWGHDSDHWLTRELVARGGSLRYRNEVGGFIPFGVAWYGDEGTEGYMYDTEMWMWA